MNRIIFLILFLPSISLADMTPITHFGISALMAPAISSELYKNGMDKNRAKVVGAAATLGAGIAKELSDKNFDGKDMFSNVLGIITGMTLYWEF
jgi:hypothetical protein